MNWHGFPSIADFRCRRVAYGKPLRGRPDFQRARNHRYLERFRACPRAERMQMMWRNTMRSGGLARLADGMLARLAQGRLGGMPPRAALVRGAGPCKAYRRVLVAVDGSEQAVACIAAARAFAPDADMVVVFALDYGLENRLRYADVAEEKIRDLRMQRHERAYDRLNLMLAAAGVQPCKVVRIVEHGYAPRLILDTEQQFLADLLVIGRGSASFLQRVFFRGVAVGVLAGARCVALLVPPAGHPPGKDR